MRRDGTPIQALLLRTFLPAVVVVAMVLAVLVYNWLYASIIDGFDRKLVTTSALTGALIDPADHDAMQRAAFAKGDVQQLEGQPAYRRNVEPMRRVRTGLDLTYLYTQAIGGGGPLSIVYVFDSALGENHSDIGARDEMTEETMHGLKRTEADGTIYVSPIEYQEQWGLLKTAAAPVYGADGRITATAGADVNISLIQVATQNALFASALIGIGSILACVLVALAIVRRVARPIAALKQEALRIAAGDAALPAPIHGPREVGRLRDALAELAERMASTAAQGRETAAIHARKADEAALAGTPPPTASERVPQAWVSRDRLGTEAAAKGSGHSDLIGEDTVRKLLMLGGIAPFDRLTEGELLMIAAHAHRRRFAPDEILLSAGTVADMLFIISEGTVLTDTGTAPAVFDAASTLFGLPVRGDYRAGEDGAAVLCLAKPHLFTIARECPDFVVGLAAAAKPVKP